MDLFERLKAMPDYEVEKLREIWFEAYRAYADEPCPYTGDDEQTAWFAGFSAYASDVCPFVVSQ